MPFKPKVCAWDDCSIVFRPRKDYPSNPWADDYCKVHRRVKKAESKEPKLHVDDVPGHPVPVEEEDPAHVYETGQLKQALRRAHQKIDELQRKRRDLEDAVYEAVSDSVSALDIPPVPPPPKRRPRKDREPEAAVAGFSDWQLGKKTESYSSEMCEKRIEEYGEKLLKITDVQRADHDVNELYVMLLGDICEGELIFPGQGHRIDASLFRQVITDGPRILTNFLRRMLNNFDKITVRGVVGNHGAIGGRSRRDMHPETNADAMIYDVTRQLMAGETRIDWGEFVEPDERKWHEVVDVMGWKFFLFHADQIRGHAGYPWYGFGKAIHGYYMMYGPFDYSMAGHFHQRVVMPIGHVVHYNGGSPESHNTYAAEQLKTMSTPNQLLLFVSGEHGVTGEYQVHLTHGYDRRRSSRIGVLP